MGNFIEKALAAAEAKRIADEAAKAEAERERLAERAKRSAMYHKNVLEILAYLGIAPEEMAEVPETSFGITGRWEFAVPVGEFRLDITISSGDPSKYVLKLVHQDLFLVTAICELRRYDDDFVGRRYKEAERWIGDFPLLAMLGTEIQNMRAKITRQEAELRKTEAEEAARKAVYEAEVEAVRLWREKKDERIRSLDAEKTDGWREALEYMKRLCERMEKPDARLDAVDRMIIGVVNFCEAVEHNLGTLD